MENWEDFKEVSREEEKNKKLEREYRIKIMASIRKELKDVFDGYYCPSDIFINEKAIKIKISTEKFLVLSELKTIKEIFKAKDCIIQLEDGISPAYMIIEITEPFTVEEDE